MTSSTMATLILSIVALVISISSLLWTIWFNLRRARVDPMLNYLSKLSDVERMIATTPSALKFHGIEERELVEAGITAQEFAYLVSSFTLGGAYHRAYMDNSQKPITPGTYRYTMCSADATRRAWPLLRRMMAHTPYRDQLEATIRIIHEQRST